MGGLEGVSCQSAVAVWEGGERAASRVSYEKGGIAKGKKWGSLRNRVGRGC